MSAEVLRDDSEPLRVKVYAVEAVLADGQIAGGKTLTMSPDAPEEVLKVAEGMCLTAAQRAFPEAAEYRPLGWRDGFLTDLDDDE